MCSEPVTLGGGITIAYGGLLLPASARNRPAATHCSYRRCSTSVGEYWAGSAESAAGRELAGSRCAVDCSVSVTRRVYGGPLTPIRCRCPLMRSQDRAQPRSGESA